MARTKVASMPEVGDEAPNFNLPSAQGGQLRLSMRTARGPVVVVFYRGTWSDEDVNYFKDLAGKEDEINLAAASVVGIGVGGPDEARDFVKQSGIKSYVLYDYAKVASREWGTLEKRQGARRTLPPGGFHRRLRPRSSPRLGRRPARRRRNCWRRSGRSPAFPRLSRREKRKRNPKNQRKLPNRRRPAEGETEKPKPDKPSPEEREKRRAAKAGREAGTELEAGEPGTAKPAAESEQTPAEKTPETGCQGAGGWKVRGWDRGEDCGVVSRKHPRTPTLL